MMLNDLKNFVHELTELCALVIVQDRFCALPITAAFGVLGGCIKNCVRQSTRVGLVIDGPT